MLTKNIVLGNLFISRDSNSFTSIQVNTVSWKTIGGT